MANYFHSALRGEQIHEAKIKVLPAGSPFPTPEWEGQLLAVGRSLYFSVKQNEVLIWQQPIASNVPTLPPNVVIFESGEQNPPSPRSGSGRIYTNTNTKDSWYLTGSQWIKLGTGSNSNFEIISGRSEANWQANEFGLLNPSNVSEDNCLLIKKYLLNTKYYLGIKTPSILSLGGSDDNLFYFEIWRNNTKILLSTHPESQESLGVINTSASIFTSTTALYRLGLYIKRNSAKLYLNFAFNLDARLMDIKSIADISYGY
jgi:hypothetical protein